MSHSAGPNQSTTPPSSPKPPSFGTNLRSFFNWVSKIGRQFVSYLKKLVSKLFNKDKEPPASKINSIPPANLRLPPPVKIHSPEDTTGLINDTMQTANTLIGTPHLSEYYRSNLKFLVQKVNSYINFDQRYFDLWFIQLQDEITKVYLQAFMPPASPASETQIAKSQILKEQIVNLCILWDKTEERETALLAANSHSQTTPVEALDAKMQALSDYKYAERDRLYAEQKQLVQSYEKAQKTYESLLATNPTAQSYPELDKLSQKLTELKNLYDAAHTPPFQIFGEKEYYKSHKKAQTLITELDALILKATEEAQVLSHKPPKNP